MRDLHVRPPVSGGLQSSVPGMTRVLRPLRDFPSEEEVRTALTSMLARPDKCVVLVGEPTD